MESDLSVFHRIDDLTALHPQRLIDLVVRLGYYPGVVQARLQAEARDDDDGFTGNVAGIGEDRVIDSSLASLASDPVLGGLIELA